MSYNQTGYCPKCHDMKKMEEKIKVLFKNCRNYFSISNCKDD